MLHNAGTQREPASFPALTDEEWESVTEQLLKLDIAPLIYASICIHPTHLNIPSSAVRKLGEAYRRSGIQNMFLYDDLRAIAGELGKEGIEFIVLKGAFLGGVTYRDPATRPMKDIDILVRLGDLPVVQKTILGMGYGPHDRPDVEEQCRRHHHLIPFTSGGKAPLEVHWTIPSPDQVARIPGDELWKRARGATIEGMPVLTLSPEDMLLHCCLHFMTNQMARKFEVKSIVDIHMLLDHYRHAFDWPLLVTSANAYGVGRYVYCALSLIREMTGADIPDDVLKSLSHDAGDAAMADIIAEHCFIQPLRVMPDAVSRLAKETSGGQKLKILFGYVFPSYRYLRARFPDLGTACRMAYYRAYLGHVLRMIGSLSLSCLLKTPEAAELLNFEKKRVTFERWIERGRCP